MKLEIGSAVVPEDGRAHPGPVEASTGTDVAVPVDNDRLRLVVAWLPAGGELRWPDGHGEDALYVLEGAVEVDGLDVPAGGAVVLHAGRAVTLRAPAGARVAHFSAPGRAPDGDGDYHLVGPDGRYRSGSPEASEAVWFADSTCEGCDVALFRVTRDTPGNRGRAHSHTADEILFLVEGGVRLGSIEVPTGHAVFIPANTRYSLTCGDTRHAFLNYRPTASLQQYEGDREPMVETGLGRGGTEVGDVIR